MSKDLNNNQESSAVRNVPISVLDLAPVNVGTTPAESFPKTLELAQHAEKLGFSRYWLAEHHNMTGIASSATSLVIGYVAAGTKKIRVGSGGIMLPNHAPLVIAEQFGTLESMYPGRIDLGLGRAPGSDQLAAQALRRGLGSNGQDFPQLLKELQGYFNSTPQSARSVRAVPGEGLNIPIWLLGSSGFSAQLAGTLGLPFAFASHFAPEYLLPALELYRSHFQPSAALDKPHVMVGINVIAAETGEEARRLVTSLQQQFLNLIRGNPGKLNPPVDNMDDLWAPHERAALESKFSYSVAGNKAEVQDKLQAILKETQADELIATAQIFDHQARLRSYEILAEAANLQPVKQD
ncbi:alkane 1-monooxygenase [Paenibacillus baekrokdamisoli]|uniref:Alkane 1-monooxygenase n=1 Tax=Paenibacillus baekrokdamisoli TaxID=1712516 RepID=A0A3G9IX35_9BACL|nr:LLM class flavin-dependent oxidoreductase [Paenibacillus baekrokdamisoli]MBB3068084.1 luciferase family oxidoreductase group 1 [Paenibacillus baekrokdamisoli]BBH22872.1 alkane 1-monooxygenase [Paenibacillus baekrokdamisoli]